MGIESALVTYVVISTITAPIRKVRNVISNIKGGPVGFLSGADRAAIVAHEQISKVEPNGILGDVIITSKLRYSLFDPIRVKVLYHEKDNQLEIMEQGIFHNLFTVLRDKIKKNQKNFDWKTIDSVLIEHGVPRHRGTIGLMIDGPPTPEKIVDGVNRVAKACLAVVSLGN